MYNVTRYLISQFHAVNKLINAFYQKKAALYLHLAGSDVSCEISLQGQCSLELVFLRRQSMCCDYPLPLSIYRQIKLLDDTKW